MQTQRQDEHNLSWELLKASFSKAGSQSSFWLGSCQEDPAGRSNWQLELGASPVSSKCSQELRSYLHARGLFTWAGGGQYLPRTKAGKRGFRLSQTRGCPRARIWCRAGPSGLGFVVAGLPRASMPGWFSAGQDLVLGGTFRGEDLVLGGPPCPSRPK